jgi:membrane protein
LAGESFTLRGVSLTEILKHTWTEILAHDVFGRAAQLAYYFLLALFPFLICIIATLSVFGAADRGRRLLFAFLARLLPAPALQLIVETFGQIVASSGPLKMSLGIIASLLSASLGMSAIMGALNEAYGVRETRSMSTRYLIAIALTLGMGLLTVISTLTVVVVIGDSITGALNLPHAASLGWRIVEWRLAIGLLLFALDVTYYYAPDLKKRTWHWITPGAVAGVLLLVLVSIGIRIYLHFYGSYNATYGSLGGAIVLLLCFYFGGVAVLAGGALNAVLEEATSRKHLSSGRQAARP